MKAKEGEKVKFTIPAYLETETPTSYEGTVLRTHADGWVDVSVKFDWRTTKVFNVKEEWIGSGIGNG